MRAAPGANAGGRDGAGERYREDVEARHLLVLRCDEDNARARLRRRLRESSERRARRWRRSRACERIANEVRMHESSVTSAGEALAAVEGDDGAQPISSSAAPVQDS